MNLKIMKCGNLKMIYPQILNLKNTKLFSSINFTNEH